MGDIMPQKRKWYSGPKYDTPTDGISRKQFDRAMDKHIRRYVKMAERVSTLSAEVSTLKLRISNGKSAEEE